MKRRMVLSVILALFAVMLAAAGHLLVNRIVTHPAFSRADYVYGNRMVVDNETPFEYDAALAVSDGIGPVGLTYWFDPLATWEQVRDVCGNKILREKDGRLYTVYSAGGNRLQYVFFEKDPDGRWALYTEGLYDTVHSFVGYGLDEYIYEQDSPAAILGDAVPSETISAERALDYVKYAEHTLYNARCNTNTPDIRQLLEDGTATQAYRMTIEGIFHGLYMFDFYVHENGAGTLHYRRYNGESVVIKGIFDDVSYPLTKQETEALLSVFTEQQFFNLPIIHPYESTYIMDGYYIYLEGIERMHTFSDGSYDFSSYHMVRIHDHSIDYPQLTAIYDALIALVESKGTEVRINAYYEEEKLREASQQ